MSDPYDVQGTIDYYKNLLIVQYHDKPNAQAVISLFISILQAAGILFQIRDGFNIDTAVGVQLDILGKYIGIDRFYNGQTLDGYFSLLPYADAVDSRIGFTTYADFNTETSPTLIYSDILSKAQALSDDDYRTLLKLKIITNNTTGSHSDIDTALYDFFAAGIVASSSGAMKMTYFITRQFYQIGLVAIQKGVLPKPIGVNIDYVIQHQASFFGFTTYNGGGGGDLLTGFTDYANYDTDSGEVLTYNDLIAV
jgi:hypothetical protein